MQGDKMTSTVSDLYRWHFLYQVPADLMTVKASQSEAAVTSKMNLSVCGSCLTLEQTTNKN